MSRGLGRVERAVLAYLPRDRYVRLDVIASAIDCHPESVRRAMESLSRKGMVALGWDNGWRDIGGEATKFWKTSCPTARLSADQSSTLIDPTTTQEAPMTTNPVQPTHTDGPGEIPRDATGLLRSMLDDWQGLFDVLWNSAEPPAQHDRILILNRQVELFGSIYFLAALRQAAPDIAELAAARVADEWDDGSGLGEWVYQWREELAAGKPLTLDLTTQEASQ